MLILGVKAVSPAFWGQGHTSGMSFLQSAGDSTGTWLCWGRPLQKGMLGRLLIPLASITGPNIPQKSVKAKLFLPFPPFFNRWAPLYL